MAKALLFKVLNDTLGKYVEGLKEENLKLSVFNGTISLKNVSLRRKGIEELNLPIAVVKGHIESIDIEIPWTKLESSPVKIFINGVFLLVKPINFEAFTPRKAVDHFLEKKASDLLQEEKMIELTSEVSRAAQDAKGSPGYFQNLTQKILDNLEIRLEEIHIRYEDSETLRGSCFALGLTLSSFIVTTTDSNWNEKFVSSKAESKQSLHKLGKFSDIGAYWIVSSSPLEDKSESEWLENMKSCIYSSSSTFGKSSDEIASPIAPYDYILEPPNIFCAKCIHRTVKEVDEATFDVSVESVNMNLHVDKLQYHQAMHAQQTMTENECRLVALQYRPEEKPKKNGNKEVSVKWWHYALILVTNKEKLLQNSAKIAHDCCIHRARYVELSLQDIKSKSEDKSLGKTPPLSMALAAEKRKIEDSLPFCALVEFRKLAMAEYDEQVKRSNAASSKGPSLSSWVGSLWGGKKTDEDKVDITAKNCLDAKKDTKTVKGSEGFSVDMTLSMRSAGISLTSEKKSIASMNLAFSSNVVYRPDISMACRMSINSISIRDEASLEPVNPFILFVSDPDKWDDSHDVKNTRDNGSRETLPLYVSFSSDLEMKRTDIKISSLPLVFCCNPGCISLLYDLVLVPPYHSSVSMDERRMIKKRESIVQSFQQYKQEAMTRKANRQSLLKDYSANPDSSDAASNEMTVEMELSAPILLLPDANSGCMRIDFGHISAMGKIPKDSQDEDKLLPKNKSGNSNGESAESTKFSVNIRDIGLSVHRSLAHVSNSMLSYQHPEAKKTLEEEGVHDLDYTNIVCQFNVLVDMTIAKEGLQTESAENEIDIKIDPSITIELTPSTVSHIFGVVEVAKDSFAVEQLEEDSSTNCSPTFAESAISAVVAANDTLYSLSDDDLHETPDVSAVAKMASRIKQFVRFSIPDIKLLLTYDTAEDQHLALSMSELVGIYSDRLFDTTISVNLGSFSVNDSSRHSHQIDVVRSIKQKSSSENALVQIKTTIFKSANSPEYSDYGCDITARLGILELILETETVSHLKPFYEVWLDIGAKQTSEEHSVVDTTNSMQSNSREKDEDTAEYSNVPQIVPAGLKLDARIQQISVEVLRSNFDCSKEDFLSSVCYFVVNELGATMHIEAEKALKSDDLDDQNSQKGRFIRGSENEQSFNVTLRTLKVTDSRPLSEEYHFRQILGPSYIDGTSAEKDQIRAVYHESSIMSTYMNPCSDGVREEEYTKKKSNLEIISSDLDVFVSIDVILELLEVSQEASRAVADLTNSNNENDEYKSDTSEEDKNNSNSLANECISKPKLNKAEETKVTKSRVISSDSAVNVTVPNVKLIFLDEPMSQNSRGFICQTEIKCVMDSHENNAMEFGQLVNDSFGLGRINKITSSVLNNVDAMLSDMEIFMAQDMMVLKRRPILSPVRASFKLTLSDERSPYMDSTDSYGIFRDCDGEGDDSSAKAGSMTSISSEFSELFLRLTLNDLLMMEKIMSQAACSEQTELPSSDEVGDDNTNDIEEVGPGNDLSRYDVSSKISKVTVILVNDFNPSCIMPIAKFLLSGFELSSNGQPFASNGTGFSGNLLLGFQLDYRNHEIADWEPVVESWYPTVSFVKKAQSLSIDINTQHTFQVTVTSNFLESFTKTYAALSTFMSKDMFQSDIGNTALDLQPYEASQSPHILIFNELGVPIKIEACSREVNSKDSIWYVDGPSPVKISQDKSDSKRSDFLNFFNVSVSKDQSKNGMDANDLDMLYSLPTKRPLKKDYRLRNQSNSEKDAQDTTVDEEIFEYQRYVIGFGRSWKAPYLATDPYNMSDKRGKRKLDKDNFSLPKEGSWEWKGSWRIDMSGEIGKNIDQEGWEYAFDFSELFARRHSNRRNMNKTDCVRRRRWIRTRTSTASSLHSNSNKSEPTCVHWEVAAKPNGCREVTIRSCFQVENQLPYPVEVCFVDDNSKRYVLGPIKSHEVFNLPLFVEDLYCGAFISINFKPSCPNSAGDCDWEWSEDVPCKRNSLEQSYHVNLCSCTNASNKKNKYFKLLQNVEGLGMRWTLHSLLQISNALPCPINFGCFRGPSTSATPPAEVESMLLRPGEEGMLHNTYLPFSNLPGECDTFYLQFPGVKHWSSPLQLASFSSSTSFPLTSLYEVFFCDSEMHEATTIENAKLVINVRLQMYSQSSSKLELFSQHVLVDYTDLGLNLSYGLSVGKNSRNVSLRLHEVDSSKAVGDKDSAKVDSCAHSTVSDIHAHSHWSYTTSLASEGDLVYTDQRARSAKSKLPHYYFVKLPASLRGQLCIHTASTDRYCSARASKFLSFRVTEDSFVCLLLDQRLDERVPDWLLKEGFKKSTENAVAWLSRQGGMKSNSEPRDHEIYYSIFSKYFSADSVVNLGTNYAGMSIAYQMYSVFVVSARKKMPNNSHLWKIAHPSAVPSENIGNDCLSSKWANGKDGMVMFGKVKGGKISVGVSMGSQTQATSEDVVWADSSLDIDSVALNAVPFQVTDKKNKSVYHLAYKIRQLPGFFSATRELSILPHYCVVNTTPHAVKLRQVGSRPGLSADVESFSTTAWHRLDGKLGTTVQLQTDGYEWSSGSVDFNDIGSSTLLLYKESSSCEYIVMNVEVQYPQPEDKCALSIVIWCNSHPVKSILSSNSNIPLASESCSVSKFSPLVLENRSSVSILVHQCPQKSFSINRALSDVPHDEVRSHAVVVLPPYTVVEYGWLQPQSTKKFLSLSLLLDENIEFSTEAASSAPKRRKSALKKCRKSLKKVAKLKQSKKKNAQSPAPECKSINIDTNDIGSRKSMRSNEEVDVLVSIEWSASGRVVRISDADDVEAVESPQKEGVSSDASEVTKDSGVINRSAMSLTVDFFSVGISLVGNSISDNKRRELISGLFDGLHVAHVVTSSVYEFGSESCIAATEITLADAQLDNFSDSAVYPVLLRRDFTQHRADEKALNIRSVPFLKLSLMVEKKTSDTGQEGQSCFHEVMANVMPFCFEIDSASVLILYEDIFSRSCWASEESALGTLNPSSWARQYNDKLKWPSSRKRNILKLSTAKSRINEAKSLYKKFHIHPVKAFITFVHKDLPKSRKKQNHQASTLETLSALAPSVDLMEVRLNSFLVANAIETTSSLQDRIVAKVTADIWSQLASIAGSLAVIGSPANMMRNIGDGVSDFFYEPITGLKDNAGIEGFFKGIGKGTSSLAKGVASGTLYSTATLLNSTASGVSCLSGDEAYMARRNAKRLKQQAKREGALSGLKSGGQSIVSGVSSGVSGVFSKPVAGAKKDGAAGFMKGLGQGLVGAFVKPMVGVGDGISDVMHGVSNEVSKGSGGSGRGVRQTRPRRTFKTSSINPDQQLLPPVCVFSALAQEIVRTIVRERMGGSKDAFLAQVCLGGVDVAEKSFDVDLLKSSEDDASEVSVSSDTEPEKFGQLILTEHYLFLLKRQDYRSFNCSKASILKEIQWYSLWEQVHYIKAISVQPASSAPGREPTNRIDIYLKGASSAKSILCASRDVVRRVHQAIDENEPKIDVSEESQSLGENRAEQDGTWLQLLLD